MKKKSANEVVERSFGVEYRPVDAIIADAVAPEKEGGATRYKLAEGIFLGIVETEKDFDFGYIEVFGFSINVTIRGGKNGMFISFPSVKTKKGDYVDLARCYDKNFHSAVKLLLEKLYA